MRTLARSAARFKAGGAAKYFGLVPTHYNLTWARHGTKQSKEIKEEEEMDEMDETEEITNELLFIYARPSAVDVLGVEANELVLVDPAVASLFKNGDDFP